MPIALSSLNQMLLCLFFHKPWPTTCFSRDAFYELLLFCKTVLRLFKWLAFLIFITSFIRTEHIGNFYITLFKTFNIFHTHLLQNRKAFCQTGLLRIGRTFFSHKTSVKRQIIFHTKLLQNCSALNSPYCCQKLRMRIVHTKM